MAQTPVNNSMPQVILNGINDQSTRAQVATPLALPQHLPLFWIQAPDGPIDNALVVASADLLSIYGQDVVNQRKPYFNHATALLEKIISTQLVMVKRLVRPSPPISVANMIPGVQYSIYNLGSVTTTTNWHSAGVAGTPSVGTIFTCTATTIGDGQVTANTPLAAGIILAVHVDSTTPIYAYSRNGDSVLTDVNGNKIYATSANNVSVGSLVVNTAYQITSLGNSNWTAAGWTTANSALGLSTPAVGDIFVASSVGTTTTGGGTANALIKVTGGVTLTYSLVSTIGTTITDNQFTVGGVTYYPILRFDKSFPGLIGNYTGIKLWAANSNAVNPGDTDVISDQNAMLFNAQIVYRPLNSTASPVTDTNGSNYCTFSTLPNAYNYKTGSNLSIQQLITNWSDDGVSTNTIPMYSPLGDVIVYQNSLNTVLGILLTAENTNLPTHGDIPAYTSQYMLDFLTAQDANGNPCYGYQINNNGIVLNSNNTIYLQGGADGDLTNATFESSVMNEILVNYNNPTCDLTDMAKYPFSVIYDTGFSLSGVNGISVKIKLPLFTEYRKDVSVGIGTHYIDGTGRRLSVSDEVSTVASLASSISIFSESTLWDTGPVRIVLHTGSGFFVDDSYSQPVSTLFDVALKRSAYFGSGNGAVIPDQNYSIFPANKLTILKDVHAISSVNARQSIWNNGGNYVQYCDMLTLFYPAFRTIYSIQDSVLESDIFMLVCADVEKKIQQIWIQTTGRTDLTQSQLVANSNLLLSNLTNGLYGKGITIVPNAYITAADAARGYSWTMDVTVLGNVQDTVLSANIIAQRQSTSTLKTG